MTCWEMLGSFPPAGPVPTRGCWQQCVSPPRHWQDSGYMIIYVTGRPDMQKHRVVAWLSQHNFPHGAVSFCDGLTHDPLRQKAAFLQSLRTEVGTGMLPGQAHGDRGSTACACLHPRGGWRCSELDHAARVELGPSTRTLLMAQRCSFVGLAPTPCKPRLSQSPGRGSPRGKGHFIPALTLLSVGRQRSPLLLAMAPPRTSLCTARWGWRRRTSTSWAGLSRSSATSARYGGGAGDRLGLQGTIADPPVSA